MTEGEAHKVASTVPYEDAVEALRKLKLRFEPALEAQTNIALLELHNIPEAAPFMKPG